MNINQIEPKFKELEEAARVAQERCDSLEERIAQVVERQESHEQATAADAHGVEVERTGDDAVFKAAADAADSPGQEAVDAIQEAETPTEIATEIAEEAVETVVNGHASPAEAIFEQAEEVVEKVATEVDDATFPEPEPEPEKVEPVATVEVVVSGNVDPRTRGLLESLKFVDNDLVKVTIINERK